MLNIVFHILGYTSRFILLCIFLHQFFDRKKNVHAYFEKCCYNKQAACRLLLTSLTTHLFFCPQQIYKVWVLLVSWIFLMGCRGRDRMVVRFTTCAVVSITTKVVSSNPFSWRGVLNTTLCDQVCLWPVASWWFSPGTLVSSTNKIDRHDIAEILLKVVLNTISQT